MTNSVYDGNKASKISRTNVPFLLNRRRFKEKRENLICILTSPYSRVLSFFLIRELLFVSFLSGVDF